MFHKIASFWLRIWPGLLIWGFVSAATVFIVYLAEIGQTHPMRRDILFVDFIGALFLAYVCYGVYLLFVHYVLEPWTAHRWAMMNPEELNRRLYPHPRSRRKG